MITLEQLQQVMPHAGKRAVLFIAPLNASMQEFDITAPKRQAAFLAQIAHESGSLRYMCELASGSAYDGRADLGNTRPEAIAIAAAHGSTPGRWWRGHGPIQITGFDNHRTCGAALGLDLLNEPHLLEILVHGCRSSGWFWKTHNLNKWADIGDFDGVSDVINRGRKTVKEGDANDYAARLAFYQRATKVLS